LLFLEKKIILFVCLHEIGLQGPKGDCIQGPPSFTQPGSKGEPGLPGVPGNNA